MVRGVPTLVATGVAVATRPGRGGLRPAEPGRADRSVGRPTPAQEHGQGSALIFFAGDLPSEDIAVDVRLNGLKDQALEFLRRHFDFPLHRAGRDEAIAAG